MSEPRPIPGFYYDKEKKKYFRILPDHQLPSGAKHSASSVRKEEEQTKKRARDTRYQRKRLHERIVRAPALHSPRTGATLLRQCGLAPNESKGRQAVSASYASDLVQEVYMQLGPCPACGNKHYYHDFDFVRSGRMLVFGEGSEQRSYINAGNFDDVFNNSVILNTLGNLPCVAGSVSANELGYVVATCGNNTMSSHHFDVLITSIPPWDSDDPTCVIHLALNPTPSTTLCAVTNPAPADVRAIALSAVDRGSNVHLLGLDTGTILSRFHSEEEFLSASWLTPSTALIGARTGAIHLWDVRAQGMALRYTHSSATTTVQAAGDGHGIWAGGPTSLALYDVRMPDAFGLPSATPQGRRKSGRRTPHHKAKLSSLPIVSIPTMRDPTFALWPSTGLLALSGGDDNSIALHSLLDGSLTRTLGPPTEHDDDVGHWIRRMRIVPDADGAETLVYTCGSSMYRWSYKEEEEGGMFCADMELLH